MSNQPMILNF